jgi:hypothetical protein
MRQDLDMHHNVDLQAAWHQTSSCLQSRPPSCPCTLASRTLAGWFSNDSPLHKTEKYRAPRPKMPATTVPENLKNDFQTTLPTSGSCTTCVHDIKHTAAQDWCAGLGANQDTLLAHLLPC